MTPAQRGRLNAVHNRLSELAEDGDPANYEALRREAAEMCVLLMEIELVTQGGRIMMASQLTPPEPDNSERAARGETLLSMHAEIEGMDGDSPRDAITDILHAIHARGGDTEAAIRMAVANFEAERDGEE